MGWFRDGHQGHEGYCVAVIELEDEPGSRLYRELRYPVDTTPRIGIRVVQAGCDCGWRSPRLQPRDPVEWAPFAPILSQHDDERLRCLWSEHVDRTPTDGHIDG